MTKLNQLRKIWDVRMSRICRGVVSYMGHFSPTIPPLRYSLLEGVEPYLVQPPTIHPSFGRWSKVRFSVSLLYDPLSRGPGKGS